MLLIAVLLMDFPSSVAASVLLWSPLLLAKGGIRQRRSAGGC